MKTLKGYKNLIKSTRKTKTGKVLNTLRSAGTKLVSKTGNKMARLAKNGIPPNPKAGAFIKKHKRLAGGAALLGTGVLAKKALSRKKENE